VDEEPWRKPARFQYTNPYVAPYLPLSQTYRQVTGRPRRRITKGENASPRASWDSRTMVRRLAPGVVVHLQRDHSQPKSSRSASKRQRTRCRSWRARVPQKKKKKPPPSKKKKDLLGREVTVVEITGD